jgi:hypothetical protein
VSIEPALLAHSKGEGSTELARFGAAGLSTQQNIKTAAIGMAGLDRNGFAEMAQGAVAQNIVSPAAFQQRDQALSDLGKESTRLGDVAAREAWRRGVYFADYTYISTPYSRSGNGGYSSNGEMGWRERRDDVFGRPARTLPLFLDSCGFRRMTGTAPQWAQQLDTYLGAIELIDPDGYASWDYPMDRVASMSALRQMMAALPADVTNGRMWPVFSIRWTWADDAHLSFNRLPGWSSRNLADLVPLTRTQRQFKSDTRELWARQAIANALVLAADPDFRWMVKTFGRIMIGGMVKHKSNRMARHLIAAVLCELFPDAQFWLLGQANFATVNGLGRMGLLDRVSTDGSWWILDSTCERFAVVEDGLITMMSLETQAKRKGERRKKERQSFFTLPEMMAANLRSLLSAAAGLWTWPPPEPLPLDLLDVDQAFELKSRYQAAQMELGL